ncbi:Neurotrypsin [Willisornis vidua]|uniref:Neurotrypsin n=1 Tax=Willisornis vidua TaxID=1566151 RepID=A0ABQ9DT72_9PASS|nr:Neurotrypsin [Willisornis vidua]
MTQHENSKMGCVIPHSNQIDKKIAMGSVRLQGGKNEFEGTVEVYLNGIWGTVCGSHWDNNDATVVCRQLALGILFWEVSDLFHIVCLITAPVFTPIRLAGGSNAHEGRVEVYHGGQWGTVCDDQWDDADAEVVCRQLGLGGVAKAWSQAHFGEGSGPVLLDEVQCTGNELSIEQCPKSSWREHNCGHKEDAGVSCTPLTDGALRLVSGKGSHEGRLEVYHSGQWGTVCDDGWTELNTQVVCRQLGFKYGKSAGLEKESYSEGSSGPIWLDDVSCSGQETNLLQCSRREWGKHDCNHQEDVRLICHPDSDSHKLSLGPPIRLMDGENKKEGRVEIFINGQWGTICDDGWSDKDAAVVCRQLGYKGAARARTMAYFGEGKGPIHVDNVKCTGSERSLADCIKQDIGTHNCRHSEDAGVICDHLSRKAPGNSNKGSDFAQASPVCFHLHLRYGNNTRNYAVRVGDYHTLVPEEYEEEIGVQQIVLHKEYRPDSSDYDIALVRLQGPEEQCARFSTHVLPACLPLRRERPQKTAPNCYITGWGDTGRAYSRTLQQAAIPLLPKRVCEERYRRRFTGRMLCAGNIQEQKRVDSCQGDSGGPLMCERPGESWVVYGVTSWGYGCGVKDSPGVYTKVSSFVPWIKSVTKL